jgi:predicted HicB family RNase H-like nuclease
LAPLGPKIGPPRAGTEVKSKFHFDFYLESLDIHAPIDYTALKRGEYMAYTEAQKRATMKYTTSNYERLNLQLRKGKKDEYRAQAAKRGLSLNAYIVSLIEKDMEEGDKP